MKFKLVVLSLVLLTFQAFSQTKNNISLVFGLVNNDVNIHGAIGDYGYNPKSGTVYGLTYSRSLSNSFAIETGIVYSNNKIQLTTIGPAGGTFNDNIKMISVPVIANYTFLKYLFADGGILIEKQTNHSTNSVVRDQSGLGLELGIGGKYEVGPVTFFLNPFLREHGAIVFNDDGSSGNLLEGGLKLGVGYSF